MQVVQVLQVLQSCGLRRERCWYRAQGAEHRAQGAEQKNIDEMIVRGQSETERRPKACFHKPVPSRELDEVKCVRTQVRSVPKKEEEALKAVEGVTTKRKALFLKPPQWGGWGVNTGVAEHLSCHFRRPFLVHFLGGQKMNKS